jgi:hypothetical protein
MHGIPSQSRIYRQNTVCVAECIAGKHTLPTTRPQSVSDLGMPGHINTAYHNHRPLPQDSSHERYNKGIYGSKPRERNINVVHLPTNPEEGGQAPIDELSNIKVPPKDEEVFADERG